MNAIERVWTPAELMAAVDLEMWETDPWVPPALFEVELFTRTVLDPCCGRGVWGQAAQAAGYNVIETDIYGWAKKPHGYDYLGHSYPIKSTDISVVFNPPFSKACEFVEAALDRGARKIACFQRWSWWADSRRRRAFWEKHPPSRIWACGDRATCWHITVPESQRVTATGLAKTTPTAHAVFVWERSHSGPPQIGKIWNPAKGQRA